MPKFCIIKVKIKTKMAIGFGTQAQKNSKCILYCMNMNCIGLTIYKVNI